MLDSCVLASGHVVSEYRDFIALRKSLSRNTTEEQ